MKIKIDIDCSPQEARAFLGLPEVAPLQDAMMKELEKRLREGLKSMDPEALIKAWLPSGATSGRPRKARASIWAGWRASLNPKACADSLFRNQVP